MASSNNMIQISKKCIMCNTVHYMTLDADKVKRWRAGEKIQDVWPEMSPDEREVLISGTCPKCWDELWS